MVPKTVERGLFDVPDDTIQARFEAYNAVHPEVYDLFRQYATQALLRGMEKFSARAIVHRIRWYHNIEKGDNAFAINDHYSSRYARKLMREDERFKGFFELRELKA